LAEPRGGIFMRYATLAFESAELRATQLLCKLLVSPFPVRGTDTRIKFQRHFPLPEGALAQKPWFAQKVVGLHKKPPREGDLTGADRSVARSALNNPKTDSRTTRSTTITTIFRSGESDAGK